MIFSSLCTYLCFLGLILALKQPICIDSSVVERLDTVTAGVKSTTQTETAYRCSAHIQVPYSEKLIKTEELVTQKWQNTVAVLSSIQSFKNKIHIIIRYDQPLIFEIKNSQFQIGSSLMMADGHLERGLIKLWIRENMSEQRLQTTLFEEVMTDLVYFIVNGDLSIEDPLTAIQTKLGSVQWPQVLKGAEAYCDSAWKASEDFQLCGQIQNQISDQDIQENLRSMTTLSLRPLLTSALINAYKNLNYKNKSELIAHLNQFLQKRFLASDQLIDMILVYSNPLKQGVQSIKNFSDLFVASDLSGRQEFKQLYSGLTDELQNSGFSDSFAEAYFDYIIEIPDRVSAQSTFFRNLEIAAQKNMKLQIAIKDQNQIWILPSRTALPLAAFNKIRSRQNIYFACSNLKEIKIEQFFDQTEKLMMIKGCDQKFDYQFSKLFESGIKEFIRQNDKLKFVQFHIPSLEMKQKELAHINNFFELVENRDVNRQEFRVLGWSQIQWSDEFHAYKPKAAIEAIEFFRN